MRILTATLFLLLLGACASETEESAEPETPAAPEIPFRIDGELDIIREGVAIRTLAIEIADNDSTRERGMMQRTSFPPSTGMLFLFDFEQMQTFWMGNTPLGLDLIFINADSVIVSFAKYAVPYSDEPINSLAPAQYVLEMPAGWVDSNGILEGDRARWAWN